MFVTYSMSVWGLWVILLTVLIQSLVAAGAHRSQSHYVPGKVSDNLSHDSFVFRSHRTFHNSLENLAVFVFPAFLAMFVSVSPTMLDYTVWVFALARIGHMVLYYCTATERNPSPRSYFYMIGLLATLWLYGVLAWQLLTSGA